VIAMPGSRAKNLKTTKTDNFVVIVGDIVVGDIAVAASIAAGIDRDIVVAGIAVVGDIVVVVVAGFAFVVVIVDNTPQMFETVLGTVVTGTVVVVGTGTVGVLDCTRVAGTINHESRDCQGKVQGE